MGTKMGQKTMLASSLAMLRGRCLKITRETSPNSTNVILMMYLGGPGSSSGTRKDLENFIEFCSAHHPSLNYTFEISEPSVSFLDLCLTISDDRITIRIHYKPTDTHSYLDYSSSHPSHCKKAIPYSQFRRICSDDDVYVAKSKEMASFFENRGYPRSVVTNSQRRTQGISRERALGNSERGDRTRRADKVPLFLT